MAHSPPAPSSEMLAAAMEAAAGRARATAKFLRLDAEAAELEAASHDILAKTARTETLADGPLTRRLRKLTERRMRVRQRAAAAAEALEEAAERERRLCARAETELDISLLREGQGARPR